MGIALRNAGFGLQFGAAGDSFDSPAVDELGGIIWSNEEQGQQPGTGSSPEAFSSAPPAAARAPAPPRTEPSETPLEQALKVMCPIKKHHGKTLGDVLREDPKAISWLATKYTSDPVVSAAAKLICEQSIGATA